MAEEWRLLDTGLRDAFYNMALDEAIAIARSENLVPNTVRFFRWARALGDSPPVPVYNDGVVKITVIIHGYVKGIASTIGNGSAIPSSVTWSKWNTQNITVSANAIAQNGQTIGMQVATGYVTYFTVNIELMGITAYSTDSPTKEATGSPSVQSEILVVPEFITGQQLLLTFLMLAIIIIVIKQRFSREYSARAN